MAPPVILVALALVLCFQRGWSQSSARPAGYLYLSPVPGASYVSAQTRFILVRLVDVAPGQILNLTNDFITVSGATSGAHPGTARQASDGRTIIFELNAGFNPGELVTVDLDPFLATGASGQAQPFEFQFMTTAPMPGSLPLTVPPLQSPVLNGSDTQQKTPTARHLATAGSGAPVRKAKVMPNGVSVPGDF